MDGKPFSSADRRWLVHTHSSQIKWWNGRSSSCVFLLCVCVCWLWCLFGSAFSSCRVIQSEKASASTLLPSIQALKWINQQVRLQTSRCAVTTISQKITSSIQLPTGSHSIMSSGVITHLFIQIPISLEDMERYETKIHVLHKIKWRTISCLILMAPCVLVCQHLWVA